jgi:hypothetical protein
LLSLSPFSPSFSPQGEPCYFPKDEEKVHLANFCPSHLVRCGICKIDIVKAEMGQHMANALLLHMSFLLTRVEVCGNECAVATAVVVVVVVSFLFRFVLFCCVLLFSCFSHGLLI